MADPVSALQPAIDLLEKDYADIERQANALLGQGKGLLMSINLLRGKAGLPPRLGWWTKGEGTEPATSGAASISLHSDSFTGKKLASAVREYLSMRKASGADAPATSREIFDALKQGGFQSGAKDDATALVVLRTMLRKNTVTFAKLSNGKYGLRAWYPNLRPPKGAAPVEETDATPDEFCDTAEEPNIFHMPDESETRAA